MRTSIGSALASGLVLVMAMSVGGSRPAEAAGNAISLGTCVAGGTEVEFSPGLGSTLAPQSTTITAILANCPVINALAPVSFSWSGTIPNAGCLSISTQTPTSTADGKLVWNDDKTTSTLKFANLTYAGIGGLVPAQLSFNITSGYLAGGILLVTANLTPATNQLGCSTATPVVVLTGNVLTATFQSVSL